MGKAPKGGFYAVQTGRKPGVYRVWPEAQAQVTGFPNAKHKKFRTIEDAQAYVNVATNATSPKSSLPADSVPTSSKSKTSIKAAASGSSLRSSRRAKPYDRPGKTSKAQEASGNPVKEKPQGYTRLPMEWSSKIEAELIKEGWLVVFTDGACQDNGKHRAAAGAGVFWANPRKAPSISERVPGKQSNQTGELYAILRALEVDPEPSAPLYIFTDSQYSIKCLTEWIAGWIAHGWKKKEGGAVLNAGLIKLIHFMISKRQGQVKLSWVKGHSNVPGNKKADKLAVQGIGRDLPRFRDFEAEREERFKAYRLSKRVTQQPDVLPSPGNDDAIDESWLLSPDEELAELEENDL